MRIALVIFSLAGGGAERVMTLLAEGWAARGEDIILITLDDPATDCHRIDEPVRRLSLYGRYQTRTSKAGPLTWSWRAWRLMKRLTLALRTERPDVVISFMDLTNVAAILATRRLSVPVIVSERVDPREWHLPVLWSTFRSLTYRFADALVVQTDAVTDWARTTHDSDARDRSSA